MIVGIYANRSIAGAMQQTTVITAKHTIKPFTQITTKDVQKTTWPASGMPKHAATSINQVLGTYTKAMIVKGDPIQKEQLALDGKKDLSSAITSLKQPDVRAFALPSKNPMIMAIQPGNRVDLSAMIDLGDKQKQKPMLMAENVLVLGIAGDKNDPVGLILALDQKTIENILPVMNNIEISLVPYNVKAGKVSENILDSNPKGGDDSVDGNGNSH